MSERAPLRGGLFVPGATGFDFRANPAPESQGRIVLTPREKRIFTGLSRQESAHPVSRVVDQALTAIVSEDLGVDVVSPDPRRQAVQRFCINTITGADRHFDSQRNRFAGSMQAGGDAFLSSLHGVPLQVGTEQFSVGEAFGILQTVTSDASLYPTDAQVLIAASLHDLTTVGIKESARKDSATLTSAETQQVKETTNTVYAGLLFDLLYSPYMGRAGYTRARERYVATRLAIQYGDDVLDVGKDMGEGSANLVVAHADALGELDSLKRKGVVFDCVDAAVDSVREAAPGAYGIVAGRQHELLDASGLPFSIARKITLPTAKVG